MQKNNLTTMELINLLSPELKSYLYDVHQETIASTIRDGKLKPSSKDYLPPDVLSLKKHRYQILAKNGTSMFNGKDAEILECYISSFPKAIRQRELTKTMTDVVDALTNLIMHIGIWITHHVYYPDFHIAVHVMSRRKDWEGEETKLLLKSVEAVYTNESTIFMPQPPVIRDLFGIRVILEQTTDKKILLKIMKIIVLVLTNPSSKEYKDFYQKKFANDNRDNPKWSGIWTVFTEGYNPGTTNPKFKGLITSVEASNNGFKFSFNEQELVNKKVGFVFREEEFEGQDGEVHNTVKPFYALSYDKVEQAKIPNPKKLQEKGEAFEDFVNSVASDNDDLPF